jgi:hypothetical protein
VPWPPKQRAAIAARMAREGKSREEISRFFRRHGYGHALMDAHRKSRGK